jgi:hypothetical protein
VANLDGTYHLWYCGSTGIVAERVFDLGLATSRDGRRFEKHSPNPVFRFGDGKHSILTATLLRRPDGSLLRENGKLRMWFSSTHFAGETGHHALYESQSSDGVHWSAPSASLLDHVYAPTILKEGRNYRMWYTDVSGDPWVMRLATSTDGQRWRVHPDPVLQPESQWEKSRLFYPAVLKADGVYLMWYGSYWSDRRNTTAIGLAASLDGYQWYRNPHNPVLRPVAERPWESHYTTSQSVIRQADGSFRIWYASRKQPPFVNKYFAINTATWEGPPSEQVKQAGEPTPLPEGVSGIDTFEDWKERQQSTLGRMLGLPDRKVPLQPERRGRIEQDGVVIEKWIYTSEPGSRVPAVLYRPAKINEAVPGVALTFGHGGSKSHPCYQYIGQLYAKLGIACLAADPIGEEERHVDGQLGTRAHDPHDVHHRAWESGRPIMGKLVWDTMRGVDFLLSREDIDPRRIGVAGNSLGGAKASWMAALDPRLSFAIVSGWAFDDVTLRSKYCTRVPNEQMRMRLAWDEYALLSAPQCRLRIVNGDADVIIDRDGNGSAWRGTQAVVDRANRALARLGLPPSVSAWLEPDGGHRPYPAHPDVVRWLLETVQPEQRLPVLTPTNFGNWCERHDVTLERLYGTTLHLRGATVVNRDIQYRPPNELTVLNPAERGSDEFTLRGWLIQIEIPGGPTSKEGSAARER